jgi:hypothetical protein
VAVIRKFIIFFVMMSVYLVQDHDGFGGLVVRMLASASNPAEAVGFFSRVKILSMPSSGGEVK